MILNVRVSFLAASFPLYLWLVRLCHAVSISRNFLVIYTPGARVSRCTEKTALEKFMDRAYAGITGVLFIMSKDVSATPTFVVIGIMIDFFQSTFDCLSFVTTQYISML